EAAARCLNVITGNAEQEIREVRSGFGAAKNEAAVKGRIGMHVDLVVMELAAEAQSVSAKHFGKVVAPVIRRIVLIHSGDGDAHYKTVEHDVFDAFELRRLDDNSRRAGTGHESEIGKLHVGSAVRPSHVVRVARHAEVKFIDGSSKRLHIAEGKQLGAATRQGV